MEKYRHRMKELEASLKIAKEQVQRPVLPLSIFWNPKTLSQNSKSSHTGRRVPSYISSTTLRMWPCVRGAVGMGASVILPTCILGCLVGLGKPADESCCSLLDLLQALYLNPQETSEGGAAIIQAAKQMHTDEGDRSFKSQGVTNDLNCSCNTRDL